MAMPLFTHFRQGFGAAFYLPPEKNSLVEKYLTISDPLIVASMEKPNEKASVDYFCQVLQKAIALNGVLENSISGFEQAEEVVPKSAEVRKELNKAYEGFAKQMVKDISTRKMSFRIALDYVKQQSAELSNQLKPLKGTLKPAVSKAVSVIEGGFEDMANTVKSQLESDLVSTDDLTPKGRGKDKTRQKRQARWQKILKSQVPVIYENAFADLKGTANKFMGKIEKFQGKYEKYIKWIGRISLTLEFYAAVSQASLKERLKGVFIFFCEDIAGWFVGLIGRYIGMIVGGAVGAVSGAGVASIVTGIAGTFAGGFIGAFVGGYIGNMIGNMIGNAYGDAFAEWVLPYAEKVKLYGEEGMEVFIEALKELWRKLEDYRDTEVQKCYF